VGTVILHSGGCAFSGRNLIFTIRNRSSPRPVVSCSNVRRDIEITVMRSPKSVPNVYLYNIISTSYIPPLDLFDVDVLNPNFQRKLTKMHSHSIYVYYVLDLFFTYCIICGRRLADCIDVSCAHRLLPLQQAQVVRIFTI